MIYFRNEDKYDMKENLFGGMNVFIQRVLSIICVVLILIGGGNYCDQLLTKKDSYKKNEAFFNSDQEFDVLFLGSSHAENGISPLFLWRNFGITSYNMAAPGNYIPSNYYRMLEILNDLEDKERQLPKVIVMDIYSDIDSTYWLHLGWDDFSLSTNKVEMINRLVSQKDRAAMGFPFFLYHSRWNELGRDDFQPDVNKFFGMYKGNYILAYPEREIISDPSDQVNADEEILDYLDLIKKKCDSLDIGLVFIQIPYSYRPDLQRASNGICQYEEAQGTLCVNYMNEGTNIDYDIDFCDAGHLNPTGMRIMTDELGKLLSSFGVEDHRGKIEAKQWDQAYEEYIQFRIAKIKEINDAKVCLMAINDPDLISTVQIYEGMLGDIQTSKLIERLESAGNQIIITKKRPEIVHGDGQTEYYDVYCKIYRRSNPEMAVHSIGFTL